MKTFMLLTVGGPLVVLTADDAATAPGALRDLRTMGITKFVAFDIPLRLARERYGSHFFVVERDFDETKDLRVIDHDGPRVFSKFNFSELGPPQTYEAPAD